MSNFKNELMNELVVREKLKKEEESAVVGGDSETACVMNRMTEQRAVSILEDIYEDQKGSVKEKNNSRHKEVCRCILPQPRCFFPAASLGNATNTSHGHSFHAIFSLSCCFLIVFSR